MQRIFKKGMIITQEKENNDELYILMEGKVGIYKGNILIKEFDRMGTIIGEMSVILGLPRTATIRATTDVKVLVHKADLDYLIKNNPDIIKKIVRSLAERLKDMTDDYYYLSEKVYVDKKENKGNL